MLKKWSSDKILKNIRFFHFFFRVKIKNICITHNKCNCSLFILKLHYISCLSTKYDKFLGIKPFSKHFPLKNRNLHDNYLTELGTSVWLDFCFVWKILNYRLLICSSFLFKLCTKGLKNSMLMKNWLKMAKNDPFLVTQHIKPQ